MCLVGRDKDISEDSNLWLYKSKTKMSLYAKKAYNPKLRTAKEIQSGNDPDLNLW